MIADRVYICFYLLCSMAAICFSFYVCIDQSYPLWVYYACLFFIGGIFFCWLAISRAYYIAILLYANYVEKLKQSVESKRD